MRPGDGTRHSAELRDAPCLTDEEIRALAAVGRRVEAHYGAPQDIEWAARSDGAADSAAGRDADRAAAVPAGDRLGGARRQARPARPGPAPADHVLALFGKPL